MAITKLKGSTQHKHTICIRKTSLRRIGASWKSATSGLFRRRRRRLDDMTSAVRTDVLTRVMMPVLSMDILVVRPSIIGVGLVGHMLVITNTDSSCVE
jgi:hypothetical protein